MTWLKTTTSTKMGLLCVWKLCAVKVWKKWCVIHLCVGALSDIEHKHASISATKVENWNLQPSVINKLNLVPNPNYKDEGHDIGSITDVLWTKYCDLLWWKRFHFFGARWGEMGTLQNGRRKFRLFLVSSPAEQLQLYDLMMVQHSFCCPSWTANNWFCNKCVEDCNLPINQCALKRHVCLHPFRAAPVVWSKK